MKRYLLFLILCLAINALTISHLANNYKTCCPDTYVVDPTTLKCICPPDQSFLTYDNKCVACISPNFWNATAKQCQTCPPNAYYDPSTQKCLACASGFILNNNKCSCPATAPFLNSNGQCVSCVAPNYWDPNNLTCNSCPKTYVFDSTQNICVCPK